jgi:CMP-N,N'-diacetyllegionaminic acid synthase
MRILFTVCGRAGSKGIRNKNIRDFVGKPLPYYTVSAIDLFLKSTNIFDYDIVVNTDSKELIDLMDNIKMRDINVIVRSEELSGDTIGKIDVINDCLQKMEERKNCTYDTVVDLDITSPLRTVKDIQHLLNVHFESHADVTTSMAPARRNPYFNQVMRTEHGFKQVIESNYTARQQAPLVYDLNASLYAYSPDYLKTGKGVLDGYCECIEMYDTGILDLDHENDFELMEVIARYLFEKNKEFREIFENIDIISGK